MNQRQIKPLFVILMLILLTGQIFCGVSLTLAQSSQIWSDPVNLSNSGSAVDPVIVANSDGVLHAIWRMEAGGFRYSKSRDGVVWSPAQTVSLPFVDKTQLGVLDPDEASREFPYRLVPAPNGVIHIFWINKNGDLMAARATSENLSTPFDWAGVEILSESVLNFDVDVTAASELHLAYLRNDDLAGVYYRRSLNGLTWSNIVNLYSSQYINSSMSYADAHVRVSVSDDSEFRTVLVGWDMRPLKRIFMATSINNGVNFSATQQFKGPEDAGGYGAPFGIELGLTGNGILMLWRVGEPGATQCPIYSQYSRDGGETWTEPTSVLDIRSLCPEQMHFLITEDEFYMLMLKFEGANPTLTVWNGEAWSPAQVQNELSSFTNPVTFDPILFGCKKETVAGTMLYLTGCDDGPGSDVWITSRPLEPLSQWFGSTLSWSYPEVLALQANQIANVVQLSEGGRVHAIWSESSQTDADTTNHSIYYAQYAGGQWSLSEKVIDGLLGEPAKISIAVGQQENLVVAWADVNSGSLVYTAANSNRAGQQTEWLDPRAIPTGTSLNASPDILVDASGTIAVAYSVPINEGRGIYVIQATGRIPEWASPVEVFDAVDAEWEKADNPQIALSGDGKLHLLFSRFTATGEHAIGLYYSQSTDGGVTWTAAELIREGSITWSDIVSSDAATLHRFWQEDRNGVVSNFHQVSRDGGSTWGEVVEITGVVDYVSTIALAQNSAGDLHFLRIVSGDTPKFLKEYSLDVEDWQWDGARWSNQTVRTIIIKGERAEVFVSGGLTVDGLLSVLVSAEYLDLEGELQSQIVAMSRQSELVNRSAEALLMMIPTPQVVSPQPTALATKPSIGEPQSQEEFFPTRYKNFVGIGLIVLIVGLGLYFARRRTPSRS